MDLCILNQGSYKGFNSLAEVLTNRSKASVGSDLNAKLQGCPRTILPPTDEAFQTYTTEIASPEAIANATNLAHGIAYHVLPEWVHLNEIPISQTFSSSPPFSTGATTPCTMTTYHSFWCSPKPRASRETTFHVIQAARIQEIPVIAKGHLIFGNLKIYSVDKVLLSPASFSDLAGLTILGLAGLVSAFGLSDPLNQAAVITVFAPDSPALGSAQGDIVRLSQAEIVAALSNQVLNGTADYSTNITAAGDGATFTTVSVVTITVRITDEEIRVYGGASSGKVIATDRIFGNGVVHVSVWIGLRSL